jgi:hypothetical protein
MKVYNPAAQFDFQSVANDRKLHDIGVFILIREPFTTTGVKHITLTGEESSSHSLVAAANNRFSADRSAQCGNDLYRSARSFRGSGLGEQR